MGRVRCPTIAGLVHVGLARARAWHDREGSRRCPARPIEQDLPVAIVWWVKMFSV